MDFWGLNFALFFFGMSKLTLQREFYTAKKIQVKDWHSFQVLSDLNNMALINYKNRIPINA